MIALPEQLQRHEPGEHCEQCGQNETCPVLKAAALCQLHEHLTQALDEIVAEYPDPGKVPAHIVLAAMMIDIKRHKVELELRHISKELPR